ncbi:MAG: 23S rRNA (uracil(747)-C(5))-methyltransferase [Methanosaeta sp. PtaU1.Bin060]|jgi:SAM-dependent methyltransferase|nr:MAG: 23S rRNA (uracil(747)-C(5))-methyltransferase [Methanosaeta sp. PtaU1.Bin060]
MGIQLDHAGLNEGSWVLKERINEYWSDGAEGYQKCIWNSIRPGMLKRRWQEIIREGVGNETARVLDVGTGPGVIALLLADMGHSVTGLDRSEEMLKMARKNAKRLGLSVDFKQGDAESIPFEDQSFDVVVNRYVLWTVPHPERVLREWKRVLRPGGRLVVVDGNWYLNLDGSIKNRFWRGSALLLASILERRNALSRSEPDWRRKLPMTFRKRPEYDAELLKGLGFTDINVHIIDRRSLGFTEYLKYGYYGDTFMISARKEMNE